MCLYMVVFFWIDEFWDMGSIFSYKYKFIVRWYICYVLYNGIVWLSKYDCDFYDFFDISMYFV